MVGILVLQLSWSWHWMTRAGFSCESRPEALYPLPFCLYPPEKKKEEERRTDIMISIHSLLSESPPSSGIISTRRFRFRFFRSILRIDATWKNRLIDSCWKNRLIDSLEPWQESIDRFLKTTFQLVWHSTPLVTTTSYRRGKSPTTWMASVQMNNLVFCFEWEQLLYKTSLCTISHQNDATMSWSRP